MRADVALVSPYPTGDHTARSGVAWYTRCLARSLTDAGASVTVFSPGDPPTFRAEMDGRVRVERCFRRGPAGAMKAASAALRADAPVVHVQHEAFLYGGADSVPGVLWSLARLRQASRGPVVTMHQVVEPSAVDRAFREVHQVNIPTPVARAGLATMQASVARIASRVIVHEQPFQRVLPGSVVFPLGGHRPPEPDRATSARAGRFREESGAADDDLLVLCFGFVAPYKGVEAALQGAQLAGPRVKLVVAGAEHPRLRGRGYLDGLRARYGHAAYFTDFVPDEDVAPWFAAADAVLLPYPQPFSSSGVLALAISHGVPALVSAPLAAVIGCPPEASVPLEPGQLAARLDDLATDKAELARIAAWTAAQQAGRSWAEVAERHLALYEEVIHAQRASRRPARVGSGR